MGHRWTQMSGYRERLFKFVEAQTVELSFSERIAPAKGLSSGFTESPGLTSWFGKR